MTTTVKPELKPCPFCGNTHTAEMTTDGEYFWIWCHTCDAEGPLADSEETAIYAWNDRPSV